MTQPLHQSKRHPSDYRDELEHAEVAAVLGELPSEHPARIAYYSGAREARGQLASWISCSRSSLTWSTGSRPRTWVTTRASMPGIRRRARQRQAFIRLSGF